MSVERYKLALPSSSQKIKEAKASLKPDVEIQEDRSDG